MADRRTIQRLVSKQSCSGNLTLASSLWIVDSLLCAYRHMSLSKSICPSPACCRGLFVDSENTKIRKYCYSGACALADWGLMPVPWVPIDLFCYTFALAVVSAGDGLQRCSIFAASRASSNLPEAFLPLINIESFDCPQ